MIVEIEAKTTLLVIFIPRFLIQSKLSLIFTKAVSFPRKTCFLYNSHDAYKNADCNSKFYVAKFNLWKRTLWKQPVIAEDEIKVIVILANK